MAELTRLRARISRPANHARLRAASGVLRQHVLLKKDRPGRIVMLMVVTIGMKMVVVEELSMGVGIVVMAL